mgnify:FL=1
MKIDIHPLTIVLALLLFLCGRFNYFFVIASIILIHDLGHLITMKIFKINVSKLIILPFGSLIESNLKYNEKTIIKFLIAISGVIFQFILFFIVNLLFKYNLINTISLDIFNKYNKFIIIFNLLPIIPLDGSKILEALLESIIPFKIIIYIKCIISIISIVILTFYLKLSLDLINILFISLFKTYEELLNINIIYNKFLLERYLYKANFKKVKYIKSIKQIYKNKINFINNVNEIKVLEKIFK